MSQRTRDTSDQNDGSEDIPGDKNVIRSVSSFVIVAHPDRKPFDPLETLVEAIEKTEPSQSVHVQEHISLCEHCHGDSKEDSCSVCLKTSNELAISLEAAGLEPVETDEITISQATHDTIAHVDEPSHSDSCETDSFRLSSLQLPYASSQSSSVSSGRSPSRLHPTSIASIADSMVASSIAATLPAFVSLRLSPTTSESEKNSDCTAYLVQASSPRSLTKREIDTGNTLSHNHVHDASALILEERRDKATGIVSIEGMGGGGESGEFESANNQGNNFSAAEVMAKLYAAASRKQQHVVSEAKTISPQDDAFSASSSSHISRSRSSFVFVCGSELMIAPQGNKQSQTPVGYDKESGRRSPSKRALGLSRQSSEHGLSLPTSIPSDDISSVASIAQNSSNTPRRTRKHQIHTKYLEQLRQLQLYINRETMVTGECHLDCRLDAAEGVSTEGEATGGGELEDRIYQHDGRFGPEHKFDIAGFNDMTNRAIIHSAARPSWQGIGRYSRRGRRLRLIRRYINALNQTSLKGSSLSSARDSTPSHQFNVVGGTITKGPTLPSHAATLPPAGTTNAAYSRTHEEDSAIATSESYVLVNDDMESSGLCEDRAISQTLLGGFVSPRSHIVECDQPDPQHAQLAMTKVPSDDYSVISADDVLPEEHIMRTIGGRHDMERNSVRDASLASLAGTLVRPETMMDEQQAHEYANEARTRSRLRAIRACALQSNQQATRQNDTHCPTEKSCAEESEEQGTNTHYCDSDEFNFDSEADDYDEFLSEASFDNDESFFMEQRRAYNEMGDHNSQSSDSSWSIVTPTNLSAANPSAASFGGIRLRPNADLDAVFTSLLVSNSANTALAHTDADLCSAILYINGCETRSRYRRMVLDTDESNEDSHTEETKQMIHEVKSQLESEEKQRSPVNSKVSHIHEIRLSQLPDSRSTPKDSTVTFDSWTQWPFILFHDFSKRVWASINSPFGKGLVIGLAIGFAGGILLRGHSKLNAGGDSFSSMLSFSKSLPASATMTSSNLAHTRSPVRQGFDIVMASALEVTEHISEVTQLTSKQVTPFTLSSSVPSTSTSLMQIEAPTSFNTPCDYDSIVYSPHFTMSSRVKTLGSKLASAGSYALSAAFSTVAYCATKFADIIFDTDQTHLDEDTELRRISRILLRSGTASQSHPHHYPSSHGRPNFFSSAPQQPVESAFQLLSRLGSGDYVQLRSPQVFPGHHVYMFAHGRRS